MYEAIMHLPSLAQGVVSDLEPLALTRLGFFHTISPDCSSGVGGEDL